MKWFSCPRDPNVFQTLEVDPGTRNLLANFKAFRFPSTATVNFVATVQFCQDLCQPVNKLIKRWQFRISQDSLIGIGNALCRWDVKDRIHLGERKDPWMRRLRQGLSIKYRKLYSQLHWRPDSPQQTFLQAQAQQSYTKNTIFSNLGNQSSRKQKDPMRNQVNF